MCNTRVLLLSTFYGPLAALYVIVQKNGGIFLNCIKRSIFLAYVIQCLLLCMMRSTVGRNCLSQIIILTLFAYNRVQSLVSRRVVYEAR